MRRLSLGVCALALAVVRPAVAQQRMVESPGFYFGLNVVVAGASALAHALLSSDADPLEALAKGALGGAVTFGGQQLVATREPALRFTGIQVAALGSNVARNAGRGLAPFSDVILPLPPFYARIRAGHEDPFTLRMSLLGATALGWALLEADRLQARLDWRETLIAGAPVFRSTSSWIYPARGQRAAECNHGDPCPGGAAGLHWNGVTIYTTGGRSAATSQGILTHELIHLTQVNRDALLHAVPMSDAALAFVGGPAHHIARMLVLDAYLPLTGLNQLMALTAPRTTRGESFRLYEFEAEAITRVR